MPGDVGRLQWEAQLEPLMLRWVHSLNTIVSAAEHAHLG